MGEILNKLNFAKSIGVDEKTIRMAIRDGKIVDGLVTKDGKPWRSEQDGRVWIDAEKAIMELAKNSNGVRVRAVGIKQLVINNAQSTDIKEVENLGEELNQSFDDAADDLPKGKHPKDSDLNKMGLRKLQAEAELKELELRQKKNELVPVSSIRSQLYRAGSEIKTGFMGLPEKIADDVLGATDRVEVVNLLKRSFGEVLKNVSELPNIKLTA